MSIPSPIAVKKQLDAKRASETTQPEKESSSTNSRKKSTGSSSQGARSSRGSGEKGRTSKSSSTNSENTVRSPRKATPKNSDQRPFIERNPHLTQKLQHHEGLQTLLSSMGGSEVRRNAGNNRAPRTVPRPTSKAKQSTNKKENN